MPKTQLLEANAKKLVPHLHKGALYQGVPKVTVENLRFDFTTALSKTQSSCRLLLQAFLRRASVDIIDKLRVRLERVNLGMQ